MTIAQETMIGRAPAPAGFTIVAHDGRRLDCPPGTSIAEALAALLPGGAPLGGWLVRDAAGRMLPPERWEKELPTAGAVIAVAAPVRGG